MSDRFSHEVEARIPGNTDAWAVASDALSILEAALGDAGKKFTCKHSASTTTNVTFRASDLPTLKRDVERHGGKLRYVSTDRDYWDGLDVTAVDTMVHASAAREAMHLSFRASGPLRVEVEAMTNSIQRSIEILKHRKRWAGAEVKATPLEVSSVAGASPRKPRAQIIHTDGLKFELHRWFVLNRDGIIVGLGSSLVVTLGVIVVQALGLLPAP